MDISFSKVLTVIETFKAVIRFPYRKDKTSCIMILKGFPKRNFPINQLSQFCKVVNCKTLYLVAIILKKTFFHLCKHNLFTKFYIICYC